MAKFKLKKQPPPTATQMAFLKQEVTKQIGPFNDARAREYAAPTAGWQESHKPDFGSTVVADEKKKLSIRVFLRNGRKSFGKYGATVGALWKWWNEGTKPHVIRPRFASILRFVARSGDIVFTTLVNHPGTAGSGHKARVDQRLKTAERRAIDRATRIGLKKLERRQK